MFAVIAVTMVIVINYYKKISEGRDIVQIISAGGLIFAGALLFIQLSLGRLFSMFNAGQSIEGLVQGSGDTRIKQGD